LAESEEDALTESQRRSQGSLRRPGQIAGVDMNAEPHIQEAS
jgi:hypothetical protein